MKNAVCPKCSTRLILSDNQEKSKRIKCWHCKVSFENPLFAISKQNLNDSKSSNTPKSIAIAIIVVGILWIIGNHSGNSTSQQKIQVSSWDNSVYQVEKYLKRNYLKDPDSYQSIEWSKVIEVNDNEYRVRHKYGAKNSFGSYNVEEKIFGLDAEGNIIYAVDVR